jgi:sarcosine oxidase gamma subunit
MFHDDTKTTDTEHTRRRRFLKAVGALGITGIAGCGGDGDGTDTPTEGTPTEGTDTPTEGTDTPTEGTDTPTEGTPTEGTDTPTEGTDTPTGTPAQPLDPPEQLLELSGGSTNPGGTLTLSGSASNPYLFGLQDVVLTLSGPDDWTISTPEKQLGDIESLGSADVSWEITVPDSASGTSELTLTTEYATTTDSAELTQAVNVTVFEPGEVPGEGIEAYYSLDESSLPPINSVTGIDASVAGSPTPGETGIKNTAFGFDNDGSRSSTTDTLTSGQDLPLNGEGATVGAWFRYTSKESFSRAYQVGGSVSGSPGAADGGWDVEFAGATNDLKLVTFTSDGSPTSSGTITLSPDTWYFVVGVVDADGGTMYVFDQDGELDASPVTVSSGRTQTDGESLVMMGGDHSDTAGRMDEVRAYSRALSEGEVLTLYEGSS